MKTIAIYLNWFNGAKSGVGAAAAEEYVNILSPAERQHILFGDGPGRDM